MGRPCGFLGRRFAGSLGWYFQGETFEPSRIYLLHQVHRPKWGGKRGEGGFGHYKVESIFVRADQIWLRDNEITIHSNILLE